MKNKLKEVRQLLQVTQQQLADEIGVSRQSIIAIESGKYIPSTILALKISKYLNKKVEDIFYL